MTQNITGAGLDDYKPTKKGINLGMEQWKEFKDLVGKIDKAIGKYSEG